MGVCLVGEGEEGRIDFGRFFSRVILVTLFYFFESVFSVVKGFLRIL